MFFSKSSYTTSLVIDFGSTSIGVAIVAKRITKKGETLLPEVIFTHREWGLAVNKPSSPEFLSGMRALLDRSLELVQKNGIAVLNKTCHKSSFDTINCVYASPWYVSQSHAVSLNNEKEVLFTERVLETMIADEVAELNKNNSGLSVIDKKVTHVKLNGYETSSPYEKFAKSISANIYMCLVQKDIIKSIEATIRKYVNTHIITHQSFSLAAYTAIRSYYPQDNFIILDIGGEVSDINIVKEGSLRYEVSFPIGKNYVLRKISEQNDEGPSVSLSKIKLTYEEQSHEDHKKDLTSTLNSIKDQWASAFKLAIKNTGSNFIPRHIFITCDADVEPFFTDTISRQEFSKDLLMTEPFTLQSVSGELFNTIVWEKTVSRDVFLCIDIFFINSITS